MKHPPSLTGRLVGPQLPSAHPRDLAAFDNFFPRPFPFAKGCMLDKTGVAQIATSVFSDALHVSAQGNAYFLDDAYYLPTVDEVRWILARSNVASMEWVVERFDCDDFAFGVRAEVGRYAYEDDDLDFGLSFGVISGSFEWAGAHMACFFIDDQKQVHLLEPRAAAAVNRGGLILQQPAELCRRCDLLIL